MDEKKKHTSAGPHSHLQSQLSWRKEDTATPGLLLFQMCRSNCLTSWTVFTTHLNHLLDPSLLSSNVHMALWLKSWRQRSLWLTASYQIKLEIDFGQGHGDYHYNSAVWPKWILWRNIVFDPRPRDIRRIQIQRFFKLHDLTSVLKVRNRKMENCDI